MLLRRYLLPIYFFFPVCIFAQVGIGTTNPSPSAQLDVTSTTKGFLPPRLALTATNSAAPVTSPATGLLIYNTATAGSSPYHVTPGFYYYDGSKWQRIINQQPDATVSFNQTTPTTGGVVFTPNTPQSTDYVYVSSTNNSMWIWNGSAYVTYTPPSSTAWYLSGGTNDAGSNKSGDVYRTGKVGIGTDAPVFALDVKSTGGLISRFDGSGRNSNSYAAIGVLGPGSNGNLWTGVGGASANNASNNTQNKAYVSADPSLDGLNLRSDNPNGYVQITAGGVDAGKEVARFTNNGSVGIGNTSPNARLDIRTNPSSISDPGEGLLGVGTSATAATTAGAGAVRYNTNGGGVLEYSNGANWNTLSSTVQRANVYASRTSNSTFDVNDNTSNYFDAFNLSSGAGNVAGVWNSSTGVYTAPRTGLYTISAGMSMNIKTAPSAYGVFHFLVMKNGFNGTEACNLALPIKGELTLPLSANITCSVPLNAGETLQIKYLQWSGGVMTVSLDPNYQGRYYFSVVEN